MPFMGKGDKREIDSVEHQFNGHEHGDQIALDEKSNDTQAKQHRAQKQIPGKRNLLHKDGIHLARVLSPSP
jgi:hypothetical protein